jgi:hypothetical protein
MSLFSKVVSLRIQVPNWSLKHINLAGNETAPVGVIKRGLGINREFGQQRIQLFAVTGAMLPVRVDWLPPPSDHRPQYNPANRELRETGSEKAGVGEDRAAEAANSLI